MTPGGNCQALALNPSTQRCVCNQALKLSVASMPLLCFSCPLTLPQLRESTFSLTLSNETEFFVSKLLFQLQDE